MELNNFGSIMKFAIDSEEKIRKLLDGVSADSKFSSVADKITGLREINKSNIKILERTRREGICEMVLHPITNFDSGIYELDSRPVSETNETQLIEYMKVADEKLSKFYADAADKLPADDAKRAFQKLAKKRYL